MFSKNLKFFRLKNNMSKKELAERCGLTPMSISHYENDARKPTMEHAKLLANALGIKISDFLGSSKDLHISHGCFRKNKKLSKNHQEYICASVEEYFDRFFSVVDCLGDNVLPAAPKLDKISFSDNIEKDSSRLRRILGLPETGPVGNLTALLENKGFLIFDKDFERDFSGINGIVNNHPYIAFNRNMTPERVRTTLLHEVAHIVFEEPKTLSEKEYEKHITAISGAVLFPAVDAQRELGFKRTKVAADMEMVCREYGISMSLLVKRAEQIGIFSTAIAKRYYMHISKLGWRVDEPSRITAEEPALFKQLAYRAINEDEISLRKGVELLRLPYEEVERSFKVIGA